MAAYAVFAKQKLQKLKVEFEEENNMKTKEEIINILTDTLCYAYCDNCGNDMDEDLCGDCHRKYQNWELSKDAAEKIADEILK